MPVFEELARFTALGFTSPQLLAVGWLGREHFPPAAGKLQGSFTEKLFELAHAFQSLDVVGARGLKDCEECGFRGGSVVQSHGSEVQVGASNLFVPSEELGALTVFPTMALHYVLAHSYVPPKRFQDAVIAAPRKAENYLCAIVAHGPKLPPWEARLVSAIASSTIRHAESAPLTALYLRVLSGVTGEADVGDWLPVIHAASMLAVTTPSSEVAPSLKRAIVRSNGQPKVQKELKRILSNLA